MIHERRTDRVTEGRERQLYSVKTKAARNRKERRGGRAADANERKQGMSKNMRMEIPP